MPDIDLDVPGSKRDVVIDYIKSIYGGNKVAQICAFQTMKGRGAMKEVLRAYGTTSFELMNRITDPIPDEAKIADDLQIMKEEDGESSIIKWSLENEPKKFEEWAKLRDDGTIDGPLAKRFEQAIRLEGTRKSFFKHASGVVISTDNMDEVCPLVLDKSSDQMITNFEMRNVEDIGLVKLDILGVDLLDKIQGVASILKCGDICE
jgi:DNA polymerase-3 subunit alpha